MFWKKASEWAKIAPNSPSAVRYGVAASKGYEKLVIVPNDPISLTFLTKIESLSTEACGEDLCPSQFEAIVSELDTTVTKFSREQRLALEHSIGQVYEGLREILQGLEGAIASSEKFEAETEDSTSRLLSLQNARNYEEVVVGLKKEIATLNSAVSRHRADAKMIRKLASNHVEDLRTKLKVAERAVKTDPLTKLSNRNGFDLQLSSAIGRSIQGETFCLAVVDIDKFKSINDTFGHLCGDAALIEISKQLSQTFALAGTSVVRVGGDEFAVLYKGSLLQLEAKLERVNTIMARTPLAYNEATFTIHASYGCIQLNASHTAESAFVQADEAMYAAKRSRRAAA
jgi:diguanylate cyclase (GGDEF)-like protein